MNTDMEDYSGKEVKSQMDEMFEKIRELAHKQFHRMFSELNILLNR